MNYKEYLTSDILPFWINNAIDDNFGGIFTCLDEVGNIIGEEKSVWFQGRALWAFSKAYNIIEQNPLYLETAKKIYNFLPFCSDIDERMFFTVTRDGKPIQKRRYFFSETFAAIGCAEYYVATHDKNAWNKAEKYFDIAYNLFKNPNLTVPKFNPENAPYKSLSPVMIMLSTAQVMRSVDKDKYAPIVSEILQELLNGGYLREDALLEHVSTTGNPVNTPTGRIVNPGHSLECAWFLMSEGLYLKDRKIIEQSTKIIDFSMKRGFDNGGIIAFTDVCGMPPVALEWDMKLWWPQCEAMIANKLAYEITNISKYKNNFDTLEEYAFSHFADRKNGEWYGYLHYDGTVSTTLKGNMFKGPFHIPRMIMIMANTEKYFQI